MKLYIKKLSPQAILPGYAHPGDAGMDLYACESVTLGRGERVQVKTGIAVHIPDEHVGLVWDKSGLSHKHGLKTMGGVIDAGYRGEIMVGMVNLGDEPYTILAGHKVAQMLIQKVERVEIEEVLDLDGSSRGEAGFGSTGK